MFDFSLKFRAIDNVSRVLKKINERVDNLKRKTRDPINIKLRTSQALANIKKIKKKMSELNESGINQARGGIAKVAGGLAFMASALKPVDVARQYELAFKDVKKAVLGTDEQLATLRQNMKKFKGASFEELSVIAAEAGKAGLGAEKVMGFSTMIAQTAKALDFGAVEAVGQMGKILTLTNQMKNAVSATNEISDMVTHLENRMSNTKAKDMLNIWSRNADFYSQLNFDNKSMAGMSAFIAQNFAQVERGATAFQMMLNRFRKKESQFGFMKIIKTKGIDGIKEVMSIIDKMTPEKRIKTFGAEAMKMIDKLLIKANMAKLDNSVSLVSGGQVGARLKEWEIFRATFDEKLNDFKKKTANTMDTIGTPMKKVVAGMMDTVTPYLDRLSAWTEKNKALSTTIAKAVMWLGGFLVVMGAVAIIMGITKMALSALSPMIVLLTGEYGLLAGATAIWNAVLAVNPVTWIILGIVALIATIALLIYNWEEVVIWLKQAWFNFKNLLMPIYELVAGFGQFIGTSELMQNAIDGVIAGFKLLTAPIRVALDLLDKFLSKFEIYNKIKNQAGMIGESIGVGIDTAWDNAKSFVGIGDLNTSSRTTIDVNVTAKQGAVAEVAKKGNQGINLRNVANGI
jgi:TP901 family phage tail tape measure protein